MHLMRRVRVALALALLSASALHAAAPPSGPASASLVVTGPAPVLAGIAAVPITPRVDAKTKVYLAGFGQNRTATGVHDDLFARALVLEKDGHRVAVVVLDLIGFFKDDADRVRDRLRREAGIEEALVCSTHTHAGPDTLGIWGASRAVTGVNAAYMQQVSDRVLDAVRKAKAGEVPVELHAASGRTHGLTKDMRQPIILDEEMGVLQGRHEGKPAFTLVSWASHPEDLGRNNRLITADYCAPLLARVEKATGAPAVFVNGPIGGLMTPLEVPISDPDTGKPAPLETFRHAELIGHAAADVALDLVRRAPACASSDLVVRRREVDVPMTNSLYRAAVTVGVLKRPLYRNGTRTYQLMAALVSTDVRTEVGLWRIGDVSIAAIPGELYPEVAHGRFQEPRCPDADFPDAPRETAVRAILTGPHRWIFGLANDEIGYIIPKSQWDLNAPFCYGRVKPQYGEVNSVGPDAAPVIVQTLQELAH